ncbi:MAG TPA: polysaccharide biosynthesis protein, partial [Geobacteraceae bacterium]
AGRKGKVQTRVIGTRPGEKLHETLVDAAEAPYAMEDGNYVLVPPALSMTGEGSSLIHPYDSSQPDHWLLPSEMTALIRDAATV